MAVRRAGHVERMSIRGTGKDSKYTKNSEKVSGREVRRDTIMKWRDAAVDGVL